MEDRILELETRVAYQDKLIDTLNDVVTEQQDLISSLEADVKWLKKQVTEMAESAHGEVQSLKPPHY